MSLATSLSPLEAVDQVLDEFGRTFDPKVFRHLLRLTDMPHPDARAHMLALLGLRMRFVLDACSLQKVLRLKLKTGKSGFLDALHAGFVRPFAPPQLDCEIRRHIDDIATACAVRPEAVARLYAEIKPLIEFVEPGTGELERLRQSMPNGEDAAFVALYLELGTVGIITEEKAYGRIDGVKTFTVSEIGKIAVCYRRQSVALMCSVPTLALGVAPILAPIACAAGLVLLIERFPKLALGAGAVLLLLAIMYPDRAKSVARSTGEALNNIFGDLGDVQRELWPIMGAFLQVLHARMEQAAAASTKLGTAPATAR